MALVDAIASDKRASDIIGKYRQRWHDEHKGQPVPVTPPPPAPTVIGTPEWFSEMQQDIANAINAAVAEVQARMPAKPVPALTETKAEAKARQDYREIELNRKQEERLSDAEAARVKARNATHMPSSGHK